MYEQDPREKLNPINSLTYHECRDRIPRLLYVQFHHDQIPEELHGHDKRYPRVEDGGPRCCNSLILVNSFTYFVLRA